ncbi:MAG TPA: helix-turn-helix domain-containing protein [Acidimicrobiales bacterium]|nr:helix-turn-helix domain-containing protein [Acidimicrobiales bacterium]
MDPHERWADADTAGRDKRNMLRLAAKAAQKADLSERAKDNAIWMAHESGASLREIAEATGIPHVTIKRIVDRAETASFP